MNPSKLIMLVRSFLFIIILLFVGCDSSMNNNIQTKVYSGKFVDSEVKGLRYSTNTLDGYTLNNGTFYYKVNEEIKFYVGNFYVGSTKGKNLITPAILNNEFDPNEPLSFKNKTKNLFILLQSLDKDKNTTNGIDLTNIDQNLSSLNINLNDISTFQELNISLVTEYDAMEHYKNTITKYKAQNFYANAYLYDYDLDKNVEFELHISIIHNNISGYLIDTTSLNEQIEYAISGKIDDGKIILESDNINYKYSIIFQKDIYKQWQGIVNRSDYYNNLFEENKIILYEEN